MEREMETQDIDSITSARACMETREFLRAVHVLRECKSPKARFLSLYSQFMVCQRQIAHLRILIYPCKASEKKALREWHKLDSMF
jgi:anaphase-promoting complex subunit 8